MAMYTISTQPFYDSFLQTYKNIYVIDQKPSGPLANIVKQLNSPKLSPFTTHTNDGCYKPCLYAVYNPTNTQQLLCIEDLGILFNYVISNNYSIDTSLTKMMNQSKVEFKKNFVCFIKTNL